MLLNPSQASRSFRQPILQLAALLFFGTGNIAEAKETLAPEVRNAAPSVEAPSDEQVGRAGPNRFVTPVNQILTPAGDQVYLTRMRPQALALSPDGKLLVAAGNSPKLIVLDPLTGKIRQRVTFPAESAKPFDPTSPHLLKPRKADILSYTGLVFSADGTRIYLSNVNGSIKIFGVDAEHSVTGLSTIPLPAANAPARSAPIPAGLALSEDGKRLYVALNLSNRLAEIELSTSKVRRLWDVGVAPYDVVLVGDRAYVSNWGGRRPGPKTLTGPAGRGTFVRVDPIRHIASEGSVSVVDLSATESATEPAKTKDILVGLHASAMALAPDRRHLAVACSESDYVRVIDTQNNQIVDTIWTKQNPAALYGASPNAIAFDARGETLYVANGTQNAIAVVEFNPGESELEGMIPVGWFPGAVVCDSAQDRLYVANIKGTALTVKYGQEETSRPKKPADKNSNKKSKKTSLKTHRSKQYHGTLSLLAIPSRKELTQMTAQVLHNYRHPLLAKAALKPRPNQPPRPVPERVGEPSVFEHVVYIIKENRTYDQVLGDVPRGNGNESLCIFGKKVTPNQHKMVNDFVLLDNTYCSGILSADGHQWTDTGFANDYMEKSFAGFPRSYPDGMNDSGVDALAYATSGFIWDNALTHGKTLRVYGEFAITKTSWKDKKNRARRQFLDYYHDFVNQTNLINISSRPAIESLRPYICKETVGWDMRIPDVFRAAQFIKELKEYEKQGEYPNLAIICLPNDHASGTRFGAPTPAAQVADNDLAFGQIVEALSHSSFWKKTCIIAIEDDPQAGWDHVSGYRTTAYVISPYTKRGKVIRTQYNQTSILRTIELMLGMPPMNQLDATATPMTDCFTRTPDFTPFTAVPNEVPLDQMNPDPKKVSDAQARDHALASANLPLDEVDQCDENLLNRILWHAMKGSQTPYPLWAVTGDDDDDNDDD